MYTGWVKCHQNPFNYMAEPAKKKGNPQGPETKRKVTARRERMKADAWINCPGRSPWFQ